MNVAVTKPLQQAATSLTTGTRLLRHMSGNVSWFNLSVVAGSSGSQGSSESRASYYLGTAKESG